MHRRSTSHRSFVCTLLLTVLASPSDYGRTESGTFATNRLRGNDRMQTETLAREESACLSQTVLSFCSLSVTWHFPKHFEAWNRVTESRHGTTYPQSTGGLPYPATFPRNDNLTSSRVQLLTPVRRFQRRLFGIRFPLTLIQRAARQRRNSTDGNAVPCRVDFYEIRFPVKSKRRIVEQGVEIVTERTRGRGTMARSLRENSRPRKTSSGLQKQASRNYEPLETLSKLLSLIIVFQQCSKRSSLERRKCLFQFLLRQAASENIES